MKLFSRIFIGMLLVALVGVSGGVFVYGQELNTVVGDFNTNETLQQKLTQGEDVDDLSLKTDVGNFNEQLISTTAVEEEIEVAVVEEEITAEEEEATVEQRELIKSRDNIAPEFLDDSDGDGLTDFDEINIYNTDPNDPNTGGGIYEDGEDVLRGLDPLSAGLTAVAFEDPRREDRGEVSGSYTIDEIVVVETETSEDGAEVIKAVEIRGTAQPKAFVTVYVFSTPVVVTVQADGDGKWIYRLEKTLEDGEHIAYAAAVNNSGKILLKSEGTEFSQRAAAVSLNTTYIAESVNGGGQDMESFFQANFVFIAGIVIVLALLLAVLLSGVTGRKDLSVRSGKTKVATSEEPTTIEKDTPEDTPPSEDDETPEIGNIV